MAWNLHHRYPTRGVTDTTLQRVIGFLPFLLPLGCGLGGWLVAGLGLEVSISDYYHTNMRDWLEGILFLTAVFLMTYRGHQRIDNLVTTVIGLGALVILVFPCRPSLPIDPSPGRIGIFQLTPGASDSIHVPSAIAFFLLLAVYIGFFFTKGEGTPTPGKRRRNRFYIGCALTIVACLLVLWALAARAHGNLGLVGPVVFGLESVMLAAFGAAWLVKGDTLWRD